MSVKKDESGRRWVEAQVEVPGSPEEVWQSIATGPGVSSWFVPTRADEREGGQIVSSFGPGMDSVSDIKAWEPPRRLLCDSQDLGPEAPSIATEWTVEARAGGKCIVRVVHSLFATGDEWDDSLEAWEKGWPDFFRILALKLAHFPGQAAAAFQVMGTAPEPKDHAWAQWIASLGFTGYTSDQRVATMDAVPDLAGQVEHTGQAGHSEELLLRLDAPSPGIAHLFAMAMGGQVYLSLRVFLFGPSAPADVEREGPAWEAWMSRQFPAPPESVTKPASNA